MVRYRSHLTSVARLAAGALTAVAISAVAQPWVDAATPTTTTAATPTTTVAGSACTATTCLFRRVGESLLRVPAGVRLLHVDAVGTNWEADIDRSAGSTTTLEGAKEPREVGGERGTVQGEPKNGEAEGRNVEVEGNLALTPSESALEVVVGGPDPLGGARSAIETAGPSSPRALIAAGGETRSTATAPTTSLPTTSLPTTSLPTSATATTPTTSVPTGATGGTTGGSIVPPGGNSELTAKPPGVIVSWLPPGSSPVIVSASKANLRQGADQALTVTAEAPTPPTLVERGALPKGTAWRDNGNGTATLSGIPLVSGVYPLLVTATDSERRSTSKRLNLVIWPVRARVPSPQSTTPSTTIGSTPAKTSPTAPPTTVGLHTAPPTTARPTTARPTTAAPTTAAPTTAAPTTAAPTTAAPKTTAPKTTAPDLSKTTSTGKGQSRHAAATPAPAITSPSHATFPEDSPASFRITAKPAATTRLSERGTLPPGVTFTSESDGTALLSGRPTAPGTYQVIVKASGTAGLSTVQELTLLVTQPPTVTSATTASFTTGTAGSFSITATGTPIPTLAETGDLPAGLAFHADTNGTATIAGTATQPGDFLLTITAQNGQLATQHLWVIVTQPPTVTSASTAPFTEGTAGSFVITASGTPTPTLAEEGPLPAGLTFQANTGGTATITGTPSRAGDDLITVTATNSVGAAFTQHLNVEVAQEPFISSPTTVTFTQRMAGTYTIDASGWPAPALSVQGALPPGLTFRDDANGTATLSGTPAQAGRYTLEVTADNHISPPTVQQVEVTVGPTPTTTKLTFRRMGETATRTTLGLVAVVDPPVAVPTGTVTFFDRSGTLGSAKLDTLGAATLIVKVPVGTHVLSASYDPTRGSGFSASSSASFDYVASPPRVLSSNSSPGTAGFTVRRALEVGGGVAALGAAGAVATGLIRRRRPRRST